MVLVNVTALRAVAIDSKEVVCSARQFPSSLQSRRTDIARSSIKQACECDGFPGTRESDKTVSPVVVSDDQCVQRAKRLQRWVGSLAG